MSWIRIPLLIILGTLLGYIWWNESSKKDARDAGRALDEDKTTAFENLSTDEAVEKTSSTDVAPRAETKKRRERASPKKFTANIEKLKSGKGKSANVALISSPSYVFYSTLTGSSERYAKTLHKQLCTVMEKQPQLLNIDYLEDLDSFFVTPKKDLAGSLYFFVVPSYETESPLDFFIETLKETYNDFRIDSRPLSLLRGFSVFGIGDKESWPEETKFCYQAKQVDKLLGRLGARRVFPLGTGCIKTDIDDNMLEYMNHLEASIRDGGSMEEEVDIADSDDESDDDEEVEDAVEPTTPPLSSTTDAEIVDVEDMGRIIKQSKKSNDFSEPSTKAMVAKDSPTYKSLTKQGYTVVGSHSGVKICRWTKSALRGRGSCYKFSFYGIKSHLCMETTPSLSCSNKCVFCWRHGTNPVGTTWRWQVDQPEDIIKGALEGHYQKIKQMRGVPGVVASRFAEAFTVKHCALSLVGEPIFYPHINRFLELLHEKHISSFLVCNAQHPAELERLDKVTQLYVSIDASTKESLKKVDRPLHRDFWERTLKCLDILRKKQTQRTVFRLTLVKDFNTSEVEGYADLVERGQPCFIEIKGVTYCGTSKSNPLTMQNVPFYEEVKDFVEKLNAALKRRGFDYDIAAEHAHSCCILMAHNRFKIDGKWHTAINYDRFFELLESGKEFMPLDYVAPTPEWAVYGADQGGFNPDDTRVHRKKAALSKATFPGLSLDASSEVSSEIAPEISSKISSEAPVLVDSSA